MRFRASCALFVLAPALAGCVHYEPQPLVAEDSMAAFSSRALDDPALISFIRANAPHVLAGDAPALPWSVEALTWVALFYNPSMRQAEAEYREAAAGLQTAASSGRNPRFSIGNSYEFPEADESPWIFQPTIDIPIRTAHKRAALVDAAQARATSAQFAFYGRIWQMRSMVRNAVVEAYVAGEEALLVADEEALRTELVSLLDARTRGGDIPPQEALRAESDLAAAQRASIALEARANAAKLDLGEVLALPEAALADMKLASPLDIDALPVPADPDAHTQALIGRLDMQASLADYLESEALLQHEIAQQYPDIEISPGYRWREVQKRWMLGLAVDLPLIDRNRGPIEAASARREANAAAFDALQNAVIADLGRALHRYRATLQQLAVADALVASSERSEQQALRAFTLGDIARDALMRVQLETLAAKRAHLTSLADAQRAFGELEDALQQPLDGSQLPLPTAAALLRASASP